MNTKLSLKIFILFFVVSNLAIGQKKNTMMSQKQVPNAIENVILYNNKPLLVQMSMTGDILVIVKELEDKPSVIENVKPKSIYVPNAIVPENEVASFESMQEMADDEMSKGTSTSTEKIDVTIVEEDAGTNLDPITQEISSKGPTNINYDYDFAFDHRAATLSFSSVNQLNQIAEQMLKNKDVNVYVQSFYFESIDISKILSKNRTKAIKDVLVIRGVDSSRIYIDESNNKDWANNRIKVSIY